MRLVNSLHGTVLDSFYTITHHGNINQSSFYATEIHDLKGLRRNLGCALLAKLAANEPDHIHDIAAYNIGLLKRLGG